MEFKRCVGHKGHHACDYPDNMVPVSKFNRYTDSSDGLQGMCSICKTYYNKINNARISVAIKLAGSQKEFRAMTKEQRDEVFAIGDNTVKWKINDKVVDITPRFKSEFGPSKPMTKRESKVVEGEKIPEGWVYIVQNPDVPWVLKIGKTFPDGIREIMSSARRFGRSELVYKFQFAEALKAEQAVHAILHYCNLRTLGYDDCGMELFKCTLEEAIDAINKVYSENDRPSLAVGE